MEFVFLLDVVGCILTSLLAAPLLVFIGIMYFVATDSDIPTWLASDNPSYFRSKVVWVTGASSGIGRALALLLAENGAHLILSGRRKVALQGVAEECRKRSGAGDSLDVLVLPFDVADMESIDAVVATAVKWKTKVDILFNNAGLGSRGLLVDWEIDEAVFMTNLMGRVKLTKSLLPHFIENDSSGHIVNTCSVAGLVSRPGRASYGAAKCAELHYFQAIQQEAATLPKVRMTACLPGLVDTDFPKNVLVAPDYNHSQSPFSKGLTAERCACLMLRAASNKMGESWMAKKPELTAAYVAYYVPQFWRCVWPLIRHKF